MIQLSPYTPNHQTALATLWHSAWLSSDPVVYSDDTVERLHGRIEDELEAGWEVTLAFESQELVGFLALKKDQAWLDQLFIAPHAQGCGIGLILLNHAKAAMPDGFKLRTSTTNLGARRFYARHGLREIEITTSPFRNVEVVVIAWEP